MKKSRLRYNIHKKNCGKNRCNIIVQACVFPAKRFYCRLLRNCFGKSNAIVADIVRSVKATDKRRSQDPQVLFTAHRNEDRVA